MPPLEHQHHLLPLRISSCSNHPQPCPCVFSQPASRSQGKHAPMGGMAVLQGGSSSYALRSDCRKTAAAVQTRYGFCGEGIQTCLPRALSFLIGYAMPPLLPRLLDHCGLQKFLSLKHEARIAIAKASYVSRLKVEVGREVKISLRERWSW
jgi:hypothetical protein